MTLGQVLDWLESSAVDLAADLRRDTSCFASLLVFVVAAVVGFAFWLFCPAPVPVGGRGDTGLTVYATGDLAFEPAVAPQPARRARELAASSMRWDSGRVTLSTPMVTDAAGYALLTSACMCGTPDAVMVVPAGGTLMLDGRAWEGEVELRRRRR